LKDSKYLFALGNQEYIDKEMSHVIDSPKICNSCELWGYYADEDGICEGCDQNSGYSQEILKRMKTLLDK
jgi:hypothetical protein